jgi:DNA-binding transcriptional regulator YbjK
MVALTRKGALRRQQVLDAAAGILLADGFRALTHRRVAEAAGVPLGTITYYFTSRDHLAGATVGLLLEQDRVRRVDVQASGASEQAVAQALVELLMPEQAATSREHVAVIYERLGEGLRDVTIRGLVDDDYADLEAHVARLLACVPGSPDPGLVLALVEGRLLRWLATDGDMADLEALVAADLRTVMRTPEAS